MIALSDTGNSESPFPFSFPAGEENALIFCSAFAALSTRRTAQHSELCAQGTTFYPGELGITSANLSFTT